MLRVGMTLRVFLILLGLFAATSAPTLIRGYYDLQSGQAASQRHEYTSAAAYYEAAARLLPWRSDLWERAALSNLSARDLEHALALFEAAQSRDALSAVGWRAFGSAYWAQGKYQSALETWSAGLQRYPAETEFYSDLALAHKGLGDYSSEKRDLEVWLATGKGSAREHYELGLLLLTADESRATDELQRAVSLDPTLSSAVATLRSSVELAATTSEESRRLQILGRGLGLVNEWALAELAFSQAVQADGQNAEAWAWLGEARQQTGADGRPELDKALGLDASDTLVRALRGLYWMRQGQPFAELTEYLAAAQMEPDNPEWQAALGGAYSSTGDLVSALRSFQKATALAPDNPGYWSLLASFCADHAIQVLDIGIPAARKAAELAPDDPQVLDTLGWAFAQAGLLYNAEMTLIKASSIAPTLAAPHLHLAETYLRKGDQASAYRELNVVRKLDADGPSGAFAEQLLTQYFP